MTYQFWLMLLQVVWIDVMLSGDNAVVIALACRHLQGRQKTLGMVWGAGFAIALRIAATAIVTTLVTLPYLSAIGAVALLVVAVKMVWGDEGDDGHVPLQTSVLGAVMTIAVADFSMSLDNVVAVAGVAHGDYPVIVGGLLLSIVIVVTGARVISEFIERWPILVWFGGALLGWVAGGLAASDPGFHATEYALALHLFGATLVPASVIVGRLAISEAPE